MIDASIIIPVKNGEKSGIDKCLKGIFSQKTDYTFEVIAIDSGSSDRSMEIMQSYPSIRLLKIKEEDFGHGKTRNMGAAEACGKYLVFLNQDAWPANEVWLDSLLDNLESGNNIAGVYSRHLPKEGCFLYIKRDLNRIPFSTVSAAIKKEVWQKIPFENEIPFGEDYTWAKKASVNGYTVVFEPKSLVYHSHNYSFKELFSRKFIEGKALKRIRSFNNPISGLFFMFAGIIFKIALDIIYIAFSGLTFKEKLKEVVISILARPVSFAGRYLGTISK